MKPIKSFEEYVAEGTVKMQQLDLSRAESLIKDSEQSYAFLLKLVKTMGIDDKGANSIIKLSYDIIMDLIRAKMLKQGFNSTGAGAHEAEVTFLRKLKFSEADVQFCNQLRYFRNGIMYYGKIFDKAYAEKVLDFLNKSYSNLK